MEARGCKVVEAVDCLCYSQEGGFLSALPDQREIDPDLSEIDEMSRRHGGLGIRYLAENGVGLESGLYVCRNPDYDIADVKNTIRCKTREGLKNFGFRPCTRKELLEQAIELNQETFARQRRGDDEFTATIKWRSWSTRPSSQTESTRWARSLTGSLAPTW